MRRLIISSTLLASALVMAGCGNNNGQGDGPLTALQGTYAFSEQVYTYYVNGAIAPATGAGKLKSPIPLKHLATLPHRQQALANLAARGGRSYASKSHSNAVHPDQGDLNSNVAWGAEVGSLTFDGNGNVTAGEVDFNEPTTTGYYTEPVTGAYTVNSDLTVEVALEGTSSGDQYDYQLALQGTSGSGAAAGAQLLEGSEDNFGDVEIGSGTMLLQTTGLSEASFNGNYTFGLQGQTCYGCAQAAQGDIFAAGVLSPNGSGTFNSTGLADIDTDFAQDNLVSVAGAYGAPDTYGRLTATLNTTNYNNGALPSGYAIYLVNADQAFVISTDQSSSTLAAAFVFGQMGLQTGTFTNASLANNYVLSETTEDLLNETTADTYSDTYLALLTASGTTLNGTGDTNLAGAVSNTVPFNYGAYTVAPNGRVTFTGTTPSGAPAPVFWLQNSGFGYGVDQLGGQTSFTQEPGLLTLQQQTATSISGSYALGSLPAATSLVGLNSSANPEAAGLVNGELTAAATELTGDGDTVFINGESGGGTNGLTGTFNVTSNGRGTITGTGNDTIFGNEVFYVVSSGQFIAMDITTGDTAPSLQVAQQ